MQSQIMHIQSFGEFFPTKTLRALNFAEFPISRGETIDQITIGGKAFDHLVRLQKLGKNRFMVLHFKTTFDLKEESIEAYNCSDLKESINLYNEVIKSITQMTEEPYDDLFQTISNDLMEIGEIYEKCEEGLKYYQTRQASIMRAQSFNYSNTMEYFLHSIQSKMRYFSHIMDKCMREMEYLESLLFDIDIVREVVLAE